MGIETVILPTGITQYTDAMAEAAINAASLQLANTLELVNVTPLIRFTETDAPADRGKSDFAHRENSIQLNVKNDDNTLKTRVFDVETINGVMTFTVPPLGTYIQAVSKTADEEVTNSTTLQNDDHLVLPVAASSRYFFHLFLRVKGDTANPDIKFGWSLPTGGTMSWLGAGETQNTAGELTESSVETLTIGDISAANIEPVHYVGVVQVGATAGNLQFQFAQNTLDATNGIIVLAGSSLALVKGSWP